MSEQTGHFGNGADDQRDDATLAGEYMLGLLPQSERRALELRIAADPAFARLVEDWTLRLQPLADAVPPTAPPARTWNAIEDAIGGRTARASVWHSVAFWRWTTALASAGALAGFVLSSALLDTGRRDALVATLQSPNPGPTLLAHLDAANGRLIVHPSGVQIPAGNVVELWVIPADGRPRSLGIMPEVRDSEMPMPAAMMPHLHSDAMLAASIEPAGGSPTGLPTGPVVASGKLQRI